MNVTHAAFDSLFRPRPDCVELADGFWLFLQAAGDMGPSGEASGHRDTALRSVGVDPADFRMVRQVHSRTVIDWFRIPPIGDRSSGTIPYGDGIMFDRDSCWAGVTVADCMPVFVEHAESGTAAILHSGWKGTGIVADAIHGICSRLDTGPEQLRVVLGPAISVEAYAVPAERAEGYAAAFGDTAVVTRNGQWYLDLETANLGILRDIGVAHVRVVRSCTFSNAELGSYRRDGADRFVRMLAVAGPFRR